MKTHSPVRPCILSRSIAVLTALILPSVASHAAQIVKADNLDNLDQTTSWVGGVLPGLGDIALWDATVMGAQSLLLGSNQSWQGLKLVNPGGAITIGAGSTLTLGTAGIDMSAATQNLTINAAVNIGDGKQVWNVAAGRTLTIAALPFKAGQSATLPNTGVLQFSTTGTIVLGATTVNLITDNQGNPWATYGLNDWAGLSSGTVVASTYTAATTALTAGAVNNVVGDINNTSLDVSALRFNDATARTINVSTSGTARTLTARGILVTANSGGGTIGGNAASSFIRPARSTIANTTSFNVIQNSAADFTIGANISNASGGALVKLVKSGTGKLILTNANGYTGGTAINEGTLQIGIGTAVGVLGAGAVANSGALAFNRSDSIVVGNAISGTGQVTQLGGGTLSLTGPNTYTGATNFPAGTMSFTALTNFGNGTALNFGGGALQWATGNTADISARTVTFNAGASALHTNGNNVTLANSIGNGGAGGFTKTGAGTLTLTAANSYSGATILTTGTLLANNATGSATGSGSVTVNTGATLGGTGSVAGAITMNSGGILAPGASVESLGAGALTLGSGAILNYEFASLASYDVTNVLTLDGLTINGGGFNLFAENTATPWSTPGTYNVLTYIGTLGGTGVGALSVLNPQGGFAYTFGATGSAVTLTIAAAGVLTNWIHDGSDSWNVGARWSAGVPNGAGQTARFNTTLTAPATVTLDGSKTIGAIVFDSAPNGYTIAPGSGGTLTLDNNANPASVQVTSGSHAISAPLSLVSNTAVDVATSGALAISGAVDGAASLTKTGNGTLVLTGTSNYSGGTALNGGTTEFNAMAALGTGNIGFNGGALRWATGNTADISTRTVTFNLAGATLDTNGNDVTLASPVGNAGTGGLTKSGAGTLTLAAANTQTGATTVNGGTLSISANDQLGDSATGAGITLNGGTLASTATFTLDNFGANMRALTIGAAGGTVKVADTTTLTVSGTVGGPGILTKTDPGTLVLSGNNSAYAGGALLIGGTVRLGSGQPNGQNGIGTGAIVFNGGTLEMNGHNLIDIIAGYGVLTNALSVLLGQTGTLKMPVRGAVTSTLTGAGIFKIVVDGNRGDWNGNASAFTGQINVSAVTPVDDFRLVNGFGFANARLHLTAGVYMVQAFNPPTGTGTETIQNIGELAGDAGSFLAGNPVGGRFVNWTVGSLNTDSAFNGVITNGAGASRLTKVGTGTLTLTGMNSYTSTTSVVGGILAIAAGSTGTATGDVLVAPGNADTATVTLAAGATLNSARFLIGSNAAVTTGGNGTVTQTGGTINSAQWFSVGEVGTGTFNMSGGILNVNSAGGTNMEVATFAASSGTVSISGASQVNLLNNGGINMGAQNTTGNGTVTQTGGTVTFYSDAGSTIGGTGALTLGAVGTGTYTYHLDGGMLIVPSIAHTTGTGVFNFNGGTVKAAGSSATFMQGLTTANVKAGGGTIDTNGNAITIAQDLLHDAALGATPDGGLTKIGAGTLTLTGAQTYSSLTTSAGITNLNSALGTGASTLNANATTNIGASQTLAALNIGPGAEVTFGDGVTPFAGDGGKDFASLGNGFSTAAVPEPGSLGLLLLGALGMLGCRRR